MGAKDFNKTVVDWISGVIKDNKYQIMMGTGKYFQYDDVINRFENNGIDLKKYRSVRVSEYIYDMNIVCRPPI